MSTDLGTRTWTEVASAAGQLLVLVPIGSFEQHGPHLPLDTDTRIAEAVARGAARTIDRCVVTPPVAIGASGEHAGFPGTLSIGTTALTTVLVELVRSADAFAGVVFVNGHGGNVEAVAAAVRTSRHDGRRVHAWSPSIPPGGDAHAGHTETSVLLALDPDVVRPFASVEGQTRPVGELVGALRSGGVAAVSTSGVLGDPAGADAAHGERVLATWIADLVATVRAWDPR